MEARSAVLQEPPISIEIQFRVRFVPLLAWRWVRSLLRSSSSRSRPSRLPVGVRRRPGSLSPWLGLDGYDTASD